MITERKESIARLTDELRIANNNLVMKSSIYENLKKTFSAMVRRIDSMLEGTRNNYLMTKHLLSDADYVVSNKDIFYLEDRCDDILFYGDRAIRIAHKYLSRQF